MHSYTDIATCTVYMYVVLIIIGSGIVLCGGGACNWSYIGGGDGRW